MLDHVGADRIEPAGELADRDLLAPHRPLDDAEVGRGQEPDVLAVLPVDLLDALGDDDLDPRLALRVRRRLARAPAPLRAPADDDLEPPTLDGVALDDAAAQPDQAVPSERLVVVVTNPARGQLVGGDVVDERVTLGIERDRLPAELLLEQLGVLGQIEDFAGDFHGLATRRRHRSTSRRCGSGRGAAGRPCPSGLVPPAPRANSLKTRQSPRSGAALRRAPALQNCNK